MDNGPVWLSDPEDGGPGAPLERVRLDRPGAPCGQVTFSASVRAVPEFQRALAAATADIDAVEDRLSTLFDRADSPAAASTTPIASVGQDTDDPDGDDAFAELDAALAAEEAEEPETSKRSLFRRRS